MLVFAKTASSIQVVSVTTTSLPGHSTGHPSSHTLRFSHRHPIAVTKSCSTWLHLHLSLLRGTSLYIIQLRQEGIPSMATAQVLPCTPPKIEQSQRYSTDSGTTDASEGSNVSSGRGSTWRLRNARVRDFAAGHLGWLSGRGLGRSSKDSHLALGNSAAEKAPTGRYHSVSPHKSQGIYLPPSNWAIAENSHD